MFPTVDGDADLPTARSEPPDAIRRECEFGELRLQSSLDANVEDASVTPSPDRQSLVVEVLEPVEQQANRGVEVQSDLLSAKLQVQRAWGSWRFWRPVEDEHRSHLVDEAREIERAGDLQIHIQESSELFDGGCHNDPHSVGVDERIQR
jgi:hypothetical protein